MTVVSKLKAIIQRGHKRKLDQQTTVVKTEAVSPVPAVKAVSPVQSVQPIEPVAPKPTVKETPAMKFHNEFMEKQLAAVTARHKAEMDSARKTYGKVSAPVEKSKMQLYHIPSEEYYLGYTKDDGVVLMSTRKRYANLTFRVLNKKQPRTIDENKAAQNGFALDMVGGTGVHSDPSTFNNLSFEEFKTLLSAKPKWQTLQAAFNLSPASHWFVQDLNKRMDRNESIVIL